MVKSGDKVGFRRTAYGVQEFGVFVGTVDDKFIVKKEDGEEVIFNFAYGNSSSAFETINHHVGWLTAKEDFIHTDRGYACAAWQESMQVKKGQKFPLFARCDKGYNYSSDRICDVWTVLDGTVTSDDFGSRFCGVPLGGYDEKKNAGKATTHYVNWYGYQFGGIILAVRGTPNYSNKFYEFNYDVELFDNIEILPSFIKYSEEDKKFSEKDGIYTSDVSIKRICSKSVIEGVVKMLAEKKFYPEICTDKNEVCVSVEDGDWKHDHICIKNMLKEYFSALGYKVSIRTEQIGESQTDSYSAVHIFSEVK